MICYSCGDFVMDESTEALVCPTCSIHYCRKCYEDGDRCSICGMTLERMGNVQVEYFNPAEMLAEISGSGSRGEPRSKVEIKCAFTVQVRSTDGIVKKEHRALTKDVSRTGICIYSKAPLKVGQIVNFEKCPVLRGRTEAEVRWVKKAKDYLYISGLKFIK
jgi:hypothetical protein